MAYTDFIAAIDLGTSHIIGIVGSKNSAGLFSILAYEMESSASCVRRGSIYNVEESANRIKRLILKLENKVGGAKINQVYVGVGGQSIRSINHVVVSTPKEGFVTQQDLDMLEEECEKFNPEMLDVLSIVSPEYFLDGKQEPNPVGVPASRIEAHFKLIVGRPSVRRNIVASISDRAKKEIAGITVSPLALADTALSDDEKDLGCALIDFGAGVTSLSVYKNSRLQDLVIIPFGSNLITRDIMSLHIVESEAERLKVTYGSAVSNKENDYTIKLNSSEGMGVREVSLSDLNIIIESRMKEILENVHTCLEQTGMKESLGAGIIITGGGAFLKNLPEVIREIFEMDVRIATLRKGLIENSSFANNPELMVAIGLLLNGTENCAEAYTEETTIEVEEQEEAQRSLFTPDNEPEEKVIKKKPAKTKEPGKKSTFMVRIKKSIESVGKGLFDDEDN